MNVTNERALYLMAVFACVKVLAESVGQLPFSLFKQDGREKQVATDHPVHALLHNAPNEYQTAQEWREWVTGCLAQRGNAYSQIIWVGPPRNQRVAELLPISPNAVTVKQDPTSRVVTYDIAQPGGGTLTLPAREILHIKLMTLDGLMGANPIQYARESIGMAIGMEQHGAGLFSRGAQPGGLLTTPQALSKEARERIRDSWEERHAGADNSARVAVLEADLKWQSIGLTSTDAQWLEGRKFQRSEIAGLYRVPPHLIGDLERATFSNVEQQGLDFVVHGLMPYLTRIEQRVALQLLNPEERKTYFAKFNANALLRGDMAARGQFYTQMIQNGAFCPNDIRDREDMNPREGGDAFLQPSNMVVSNGKTPAEAPKPAEK